MTGTKRKRYPLPKEIDRLLSEHQLWLSSKGRAGKRLDREELRFKDLNLDGVDFSKARLPYAHFEGGNVRGARFTGAYLHSATFNACDVGGTDFTGADLRWATFDTNHEQARFEGANLYKTAWTIEEGAENDVVYALTLLTNTPGIT